MTVLSTSTAEVDKKLVGERPDKAINNHTDAYMRHCITSLGRPAPACSQLRLSTERFYGILGHDHIRLNAIFYEGKQRH